MTPLRPSVMIPPSRNSSLPLQNFVVFNSSASATCAGSEINYLSSAILLTFTLLLFLVLSVFLFVLMLGSGWRENGEWAASGGLEIGVRK